MKFPIIWWSIGFSLLVITLLTDWPLDFFVVFYMAVSIRVVIEGHARFISTATNLKYLRSTPRYGTISPLQGPIL